SMQQVVDKLIIELEGQLLEKKVKIRLTDAARQWLATEGYDPDFGARPLRRLIMKEIGDVLSEEILFGHLNSGGIAQIDIIDNKLSFSYSK
ncbi:MAG: ATP-dependent Clp protease ATP-binding subunit ClpA, partial [Desulfocapsaceae bacterium]